MTDHESLGRGVYHIDTHYISSGVASFYAVIHQDQLAVIETGTSFSLPYLQVLLDDLNIAQDQVSYVVPTHVHLDHAGGAGVMMQAFPDARLIIHPSGAKHMIDPTQLVAASKQVYGEDTFNRLYGEIPPIEASRVITAEHNSSFRLGDREFQIVHTPGHAYHHFCVVDPYSEGIFTGDTFGLSYPNLLYQGERFIIPTTTPTHFNPEALLESIDLLMSFAPKQMYLTHFNKLSNPAASVDQYKNLIRSFVELTQQVQPIDDAGLDTLMQQMGDLLQRQFALDDATINGQLANDIQLNSQGLAYWYRKQHG